MSERAATRVVVAGTAAQAPEDAGEQPQGLVARWRTLLALGFGYFIDQGEAQAMSVLFPTLQALWGLSYSQLGIIGTIRNVLQALSAPFWGYAADRFPRKRIIMLGTGVWGIWTLLIGFSQDYSQLLILRAISGIGLGCLLPATFSLISDTFAPQRRGRALGVLQAIGMLGIIIGTLALGQLASPALWRWGFVGLGAFSILSGLVVWLFVDEPVRGAAEPELAGRITAEAAAQYRMSLPDVRRVLAIPTIWVAVAQGLAGTLPWMVLTLYFITWLVNERGLSEGPATYVFAGIVVGTAISQLLGGFLGDWAEVRFPRYGRPAVGHISIVAAIPLSYVLLTRTASWPFVAVFVLGFVTAVFISWTGTGAKEPMMQAVTAPELRATAFAIVTFIESGFAAVAPFLAGVLADRIGLTEAMVWTVTFPWVICAAIYSLFYITYPQDAAKLRGLMAQRAEAL
ncbi:MAG: MFS transporter [Anaerolineae bacterium]|nr:MFS transporter [Anaerolineae bacterium]